MSTEEFHAPREEAHTAESEKTSQVPSILDYLIGLRPMR